MFGARARKGIWPATTAVGQVGSLRLRLYLLYDSDEGVSREISDLFQDGWLPGAPTLRRLSDCLPDEPSWDQRLATVAGGEVAARYVRSLRSLATVIGLDRIRQVGTPPSPIAGYLPSGQAQLHRYLWHLDKALLRQDGETPTFVRLASFGMPVPDVDTSVGRSSWEPRRETYDDARRRLRLESGRSPREVEAALQRIVERGGYLLPDTSPRLPRAAEWTWLRIRHRLTYTDVARRWEQEHPADIRLQPQGDQEARQWEHEHPELPAGILGVRDAVAQVRGAVRRFAERAQIDVTTGPGRRPGDSTARR